MDAALQRWLRGKVRAKKMQNFQGTAKVPNDNFGWFTSRVDL
jgi:hypothetical protein